MLFTQPRKLDLAIISKTAFEDRKVRIPAGDLVLRADLHKTKKTVGLSGIPHLSAESDGAGHADRFWAGLLGIAAASPSKYPPADIFFGEDDESEYYGMGATRLL